MHPCHSSIICFLLGQLRAKILKDRLTCFSLFYLFKSVMQPTRNRSQMEVAFQHLEAHMLFICPECGETYQSQQQWRQHLNFHHDYLCKKPEDFGFIEINDRFHECQICNVMVADGKRAIALLQYHRFLHLPHSRTYRCRHCPASFTRKRVLCEHLCRNHEHFVGDKVTDTAKKLPAASNNETSMKSSIEFPKIPDLSKNIGSSNAAENPEFYIRYICPQCGKLIEDYKKWMIHIKAMHTEAVRSDCEMQRVTGTKNYYCKICRKVIFSSDTARLQRHYFSHMPHKVAFQCTFCKVRRTYKTELLHHFIRTHIKEFETQKKYVRKPIEWGADINELLDKELDLLLQYGSGVGSIKGPRSMQFTSTTITNNFSQNSRQTFKNETARKQKSLLGAESDTASVRTRYRAGATSEPTAKRKRNEMKQSTAQTGLDYSKQNSQSSTKNELEALCFEIFGDIDMEAEMVAQSEENLSQHAADQSTNDINDNNQEEIVSIEINPLDESEISQLEETESEETFQPRKRQKLRDSIEVATSSAPKSKHYPTLKSLFNAKILHLCPKCGISFGEQSVWRDHVLTAHDNLNKMIEDGFKLLEDQDSYLCLSCMQVLPTTNKSELQRHSFTHMPYYAYLKCTLCGTSKSNKSKMLRHLESDHGSLLEKSSTIENKEDYAKEPLSKDIKLKKEVDGEKIASTSMKKGDFLHLMKHLMNARQRLNRIATGIETF